MTRTSTTSRLAWAIVLAPFLVVAVAVGFRPPIPQPAEFHDFADRRTLFGIPNFFDVVTNLPFLVVGIVGLLRLRAGETREARASFAVRAAFAAAMLGTFVGSSYYHLEPTTERLFYDRLPLAMLFGAVLLIVLEDRGRMRTNGAVLACFMAASAGSIIYWAHTERIGAGDLRPYLVVQFGGIFSVVAALVVFRRSPGNSLHYVAATALYAAALVAQQFDKSIFRALGETLSGHSLKHLLAAGAAWMFASPAPAREKTANV